MRVAPWAAALILVDLGQRRLADRPADDPEQRDDRDLQDDRQPEDRPEPFHRVRMVPGPVQAGSAVSVESGAG